MHTRPTGSVLMEEVTREEDEVDLGIPSYLQYLAERVDGILSSDGILLGVADMVVRGQEDSEAATEGGQLMNARVHVYS